MFLNAENRIEWKRAALGAAVVILCAIGGFLGWDSFSQPFFRDFDGTFWNYLGELGAWKSLAAASLAIFIAAKLTRKMPRIQELAANAFGAIILAEAAAAVLKIAVGRMRPLMFEALAVTGFSPFSLSDTYHSFPSGHAAAAFAFFVSVGLMNPKCKPLTWTLAVLVALSRIISGAHWPSDVIAGAFIGMLAADLAVYIRQSGFVKSLKI